MKWRIGYAVIAAVLSGVSTPLAKLLVGEVPPVLLAGLLYAGSGVGLAVVMTVRSATANESRAIAFPRDREWLWLAGATACGGIAGPVLLMGALVTMPASAAALLLNLEAAFTALFAWLLFRENFDRRIALGMLAIVGGGVLLSWQPGSDGAGMMSGLLVAGACACCQHSHETVRNGNEPHVHSHTHEPLAHSHEHYPDEHHRHRH